MCRPSVEFKSAGGDGSYEGRNAAGLSQRAATESPRAHARNDRRLIFSVFALRVCAHCARVGVAVAGLLR